MHDDQIRGLLRRLEAAGEPDPAFADALYQRLVLVGRHERLSRLPLLLLAATLLLALAATAAVGANLVRLPLVVDASPTPSASADTTPAPSRTPEPSTPVAATATAAPSSPEDDPSRPEVIGRVVAAAANGIALRAQPAADAAVVTRVNAGQRMRVVGGPTDAGGLTWYEVRIGPGELRGWASIGPDGTWLALVADGALVYSCTDCEAGGGGVYSSAADGSNTRHIGDDQLLDWAWSPDGTRMVGTRPGDESAPDPAVVVMNADGSGATVVGRGYAPAWSPDGTRLAWSTGDGLVVTDEELQPTTLDLGVAGIGTARWSPDGRRLAFAAIDCPECPPGEPIAGDPPAGVWTVGVEGEDPRQLTGGDYSGTPSWSPDGTRLLMLLHDLSGEFPTRSYTMPADGGERSFLHEGALVLSAAWSPDGTRMAFIGEHGLMVANGDGLNAELLVPTGTHGIFEVAWAPSGTSIVYVTGGASDGSGADVWVTPTEGGQPQRVTPEEAEAQQATWQPILEPLP